MNQIVNILNNFNPRPHNVNAYDSPQAQNARLDAFHQVLGLTEQFLIMGGHLNLDMEVNTLQYIGNDGSVIRTLRDIDSDRLADLPPSKFFFFFFNQKSNYSNSISIPTRSVQVF